MMIAEEELRPGNEKSRMEFIHRDVNGLRPRAGILKKPQVNL